MIDDRPEAMQFVSGRHDSLKPSSVWPKLSATTAFCMISMDQPANRSQMESTANCSTKHWLTGLRLYTVAKPAAASEMATHVSYYYVPTAPRVQRASRRDLAGDADLHHATRFGAGGVLLAQFSRQGCQIALGSTGGRCRQVVASRPAEDGAHAGLRGAHDDEDRRLCTQELCPWATDKGLPNAVPRLIRRRVRTPPWCRVRRRPSCLHRGQLPPVWWDRISKCPCRRGSRSSCLERCVNSSTKDSAASSTCVGMIGAVHEPTSFQAPLLNRVPELVQKFSNEKLVVFHCQYSLHRGPQRDAKSA
eukprot:s11874_g1.t1